MNKNNKKDKQRTIAGVQIILLVLGATLVVLGLLGGEASEILSKATVICMDCIGIG